jgi:cytochrome P450
MLSFLGGPRACIGYRLSLMEYVFLCIMFNDTYTAIRIKAILFTLVRAFKFDLAVPASCIVKKQGIIQRPAVVSEKEVGNQMPLLIKPYVGGNLD